jgi:hypothetical protein
MRGGSGRTKGAFPSSAHCSAVGKPSKKDSQPCKGVPNAPLASGFLGRFGGPAEPLVTATRSKPTEKTGIQPRGLRPMGLKDWRLKARQKPEYRERPVRMEAPAGKTPGSRHLAVYQPKKTAYSLARHRLANHLTCQQTSRRKPTPSVLLVALQKRNEVCKILAAQGTFKPVWHQ